MPNRPDQKNGRAVLLAPGSSTTDAHGPRSSDRKRILEFREALSSEAAFRRFYEVALPRVYGYLLNRCGQDAVVAEDLTQAAFVEALRGRDTFDGRSDAVTWVIGIARHKLLDHFRAREREQRGRLRLVIRELTVETDEGVWRRVDDRSALAEALERLPASQRVVLILHYADGLSIRDVARAVGRSESATESLIARGRDALRRIFTETSDD